MFINVSIRWAIISINFCNLTILSSDCSQLVILTFESLIVEGPLVVDAYYISSVANLEGAGILFCCCYYYRRVLGLNGEFCLLTLVYYTSLVVAE